MQIFDVVHLYDVDGGFGDAVGREKTLVTFTNYDDALAFVKKYEKPHVYDVPYSYLECGELQIVERTILSSLSEFDTEEVKHFWWLTNEVIDVEDDEDDDWTEEDEELMKKWYGKKGE